MIHLSSLLLVQACPWTSGPDLLQHPLHQDVVQVILRVTTSIHASIVRAKLVTLCMYFIVVHIATVMYCSIRQAVHKYLVIRGICYLDIFPLSLFRLLSQYQFIF